jgi:hypothetical protein
MTGVPAPELPPELAAQFALAADGTVLLRASRPAQGDAVIFPPRLYAGDRLDPTTEVLIPGDGRVNCLTRVRVRPPYGLPPGYVIGFVDLEAAPLRLFGLFAPEDADSLVPGSPVRLRLMPLGTDNDATPCLRPVFVPAAKPLTETRP